MNDNIATESSAKKKKTSIWSKLLSLLTFVVLLAYFPVVMNFVQKEKNELVCHEIVTKVNATHNVLITNTGLERIVRTNFPGLIGTPCRDLDLHQMEKTIETTNEVRHCDIYITPGGVMHVEIRQREPIMRVFLQNSSYYMDTESNRIPVRREMRTSCVVVNGNVSSLLDGEELITLCRYINADNFWRAQIEQIYVTDRQEFILTPRVGDHVVEFGNIADYQAKFDRLYALYTSGWQLNEWNKYKRVNLKYKGQVVCTKR